MLERIFFSSLALLIVSDEIRSKLRPNSTTHARPAQQLSESQSSRTPPTSTAISPVTIIIESPISPGPAYAADETETFVWPTEVENRLLDPGVVSDSQTQALLLTTLVGFALIFTTSKQAFPS